MSILVEIARKKIEMRKTEESTNIFLGKFSFQLNEVKGNKRKLIL